MDVVIAGGHGKVALQLARVLTARGDRIRGLIRNPAQGPDLSDAGAEPVVLDLEQASTAELADAIRGADAVVFAAGAGAGSGVPRKETVDYAAAAKLVQAAEQAGSARYLMISSMGAGDPPEGEDVFSVYLRAKARADRELMTSGLDWTIVRPGRLTDDPPTGRVRLDHSVPRGAVPRADVAAVIAAALDDERTIGQVLELVGGETPIADALAAVSA